MEDISTRAIFIGVSLFITIFTLSAIVLYFNTARQAADIVSKRTDIASKYDLVVNNNEFEGELTGVEVRALLTRFVGEDRINITLKFNDSAKTEVQVDRSWINEIGVINEAKLDIIEPVAKFKVEKRTISSLTQYSIKEI